MFKEVAFTLRRVGRYDAHSEIENLFAKHDRHDPGGRCRWRYAIIRYGEHFICCVRTTDSSVIATAAGSRPWKVVGSPQLGERVDFLIHFSPVKSKHFTPFRESDQYAQECLRRKFDHAIDVASITIEGRSSEFIGKPRFFHTVPAALCRVTGRVIDQDALNTLFQHGAGGSRSFGLGVPFPETSLIACFMRDAVETSIGSEHRLSSQMLRAVA